MTDYAFKTDADSGHIEAPDWNDACQQLEAMFSDAMIDDGAWGWVEDEDGERHEIGIR
jgi:hypothetical protein